jgi:nucleotide-binding universal stress UspA family protein
MAYKRILVPVDGSPTSAKGLKEAIKLARESRARLRLLYVVEEYAAFAAPELGANVGPLLDALAAAGRKKLARIERSVRAAGARPETALVEDYGGRVADAIVQQAKRWRADLIVMGTHGRRGVKRVLLGSDADLVVRYSPVPVLLIPAAGRR